MLLLLAVYGLRAWEVDALTLDDIDWRSAVFHVREPKAGHTGTYPLTPEVDGARPWSPHSESRDGKISIYGSPLKSIL